jgi:stearoyl-CoA desaturase (Delta-9 desaturase)
MQYPTTRVPSTGGNEPPRSAPARELYQSDYMRLMLRNHFLAVVILPTAGLITALALAYRYGISAVDLSLLVIFYALTFAGVEIGYHRLFAHRSFQCKPVVRFALAALGAMAAQGPVIYWTAVHRHHHAFSDRQGDIHSPHLVQSGHLNLLKGLWHAHMGWMFGHDIPNSSFYAQDLLQDKVVRRVNANYYWCIVAGLVIPGVIGWLASGSLLGALTGFLWGGLARIFFVHHFTWSVNSICHALGSRPYPAKDNSCNNYWLALPTFGQSFHNNHHAFPFSARMGLIWYQLDVGMAVIRVLQCTGLVWDVKEPTKRMIAEKRREHRLSNTSVG